MPQFPTTPSATALALSTSTAFTVSRLAADEIAAVCADYGVARAELEAPGARLPATTLPALWVAIARRVADPSLALRAAAHVAPNAYRAVDHLASVAPSVGVAFHQIAACLPLINESVQLVFDDDADGTWVRIVGNSPLPEMYVEYVLATICVRVREHTGIDVTPARAELAQPKHHETRGHVSIFGRAVRFAAPRSQILIARHVWATPLSTSDPGVFEVLRAHVAKLVAARTPMGTEPVAATRWAIRMQLGDGPVTLATVARRLATSTRSLQRRLADHGVCFQQVLDQVRDEIARSRLSDPTRSLGEVASELGFAQQSSFTRAARRWTGAAPSELRRSCER